MRFINPKTDFAANLSADELEDLEQREMFIHDQRNAIRLALRQGIEQGIEQGRRAEKLQIARALLPLHEDEAIAQITGLSPEEIRQLR